MAAADWPSDYGNSATVYLTYYLHSTSLPYIPYSSSLGPRGSTPLVANFSFFFFMSSLWTCYYVYFLRLSSTFLPVAILIFSFPHLVQCTLATAGWPSDTALSATVLSPTYYLYSISLTPHR
ncbi:hypothetical protein GGS20DRAFT_533824 [Poronia punctata]|nr:hypothetical protein GGS20DRAFT_533824 [Poronia punctata]